MQFLKLESNYGCCTSQANDEVIILEWFIIDTNKLYTDIRKKASDIDFNLQYKN